MSLPPAPLARNLTAIETRKVMSLLEEHFDEKQGAFQHGYHDDKIATECDVPRACVVRLREEAFGPLKVDPILAREISLLRNDLQTLMADAAKADAGFTERAAAIESRIEQLSKKINSQS